LLRKKTGHRTLRRLGVALVLTMGSLLPSEPAIANHGFCPNPPLPPSTQTFAGREVDCTFYTNIHTDPSFLITNGLWNWPGGYWDAGVFNTPGENNITKFIEWIEQGIWICGPANALNCPGADQDARDIAGARAVGDSFIVNSMLGMTGDQLQNCYGLPYMFCGIAYAQDPIHWNDWRARVTSLANAGLINWNETLSHSSLINISGPGYSNGGARSDSLIYWLTLPVPGAPRLADETTYANDDGSSGDYITFRSPNPGNPVLYRINRKCGNVTGDINEIPIAPSVTFNMEANVNITALDSEAPTTAGMATDVNPNITIPQIRDITVTREYIIIPAVGGSPISLNTISISGNGITNLNQGFNNPYSRSGDNILTASAAAGHSLVPGDQVCAKITITPWSGTVDLAGNVISTVNASDSRTGCTTIVTRPYLRVYGGDVFSGASAACPGWPAANGGAYGFLKNASRGTTGQLSVVAMGLIDGFGSASMRSLAPVGPTGLDIGNDGTTYGFFASGTRCPLNYSGDSLGLLPTANPGTLDITSFGNAIKHLYNGDLTISNTGVVPVAALASNKRDILIYVNGNVRINSNIQYGAGGLAVPPSRRPFVRIVASGNITILNTVTRIDGHLVAQNGEVQTCRGPLGQNLGGISFFCSNQLTINGSISAKIIRWQRAYGSLKDAVSLPGAEVVGGSGAFRACTNQPSVAPNRAICASEWTLFTPENYIFTPNPVLNNSPTASTVVDSISVLPPVL
jgi:hypothetical protein